MIVHGDFLFVTFRKFTLALFTYVKHGSSLFRYFFIASLQITTHLSISRRKVLFEYRYWRFSLEVLIFRVFADGHGLYINMIKVGLYINMIKVFGIEALRLGPLTYQTLLTEHESQQS